MTGADANVEAPSFFIVPWPVRAYYRVLLVLEAGASIFIVDAGRGAVGLNGFYELGYFLFVYRWGQEIIHYTFFDVDMFWAWKHRDAMEIG